MKMLSNDTRYNPRYAMKDNCMIRIDMGNTFETALTNKFSKEEKDEDLLKLLKTFNENILRIDSAVQQFVVSEDVLGQIEGNNIRLNMSRMGTGEKLFAICFMAHETKTPIIVSDDLCQLDMKHIKMFFKLWGNSPYIDVIIPNGMNAYVIQRMYQIIVDENFEMEGIS